MTIESVILYILSGYGIVSVFVLIKLLIKSNKLEVESRVNDLKCKERLCKLEDKVKKHLEEDDRRLKEEMDRLEAIRKSLVGYIDVNIGNIDTASVKVKDLKANLSDLGIEYDDENFPNEPTSSKDKDLLLG